MPVTCQDFLRVEAYRDSYKPSFDTNAGKGDKPWCVTFFFLNFKLQNKNSCISLLPWHDFFKEVGFLLRLEWPWAHLLRAFALRSHWFSTWRCRNLAFWSINFWVLALSPNESSWPNDWDEIYHGYRLKMIETKSLRLKKTYADLSFFFPDIWGFFTNDLTSSHSIVFV